MHFLFRVIDADLTPKRQIYNQVAIPINGQHTYAPIIT